MTVGDRIRKAREEKGISQTGLAEMVGVCKQTLYKYETNIVTNIPSDKIEKIAAALDVSEPYLMGWDDNLTKDNADLIPDILSDNELLKHVKKLMLLSTEHKQTIYDNIDFLFDKEGH